MSFTLYIQHWDEISSTYDYVLDTENQIKDLNYSYKILNSSDKDYGNDWIKIDKIGYNRSFTYALKDFINTDHEYFGWLCGDITSENWKVILDRTNEVLNAYSPASYAVFCKKSHFSSPEMTSLGTVEDDSNLHINILQDGMFVFYRRNIVEQFLKFIDYFSEQYDQSLLKVGWGIDHVLAAICLYNDEVMLKDNSCTVMHNLSSSGIYSNDPFKETAEVVKYFLKYCNKNNINCIDFSKMIWEKTVPFTEFPEISN